MRARATIFPLVESLVNMVPFRPLPDIRRRASPFATLLPAVCAAFSPPSGHVIWCTASARPFLVLPPSFAAPLVLPPSFAAPPLPRNTNDAPLLRTSFAPHPHRFPSPASLRIHLPVSSLLLPGWGGVGPPPFRPFRSQPKASALVMEGHPVDRVFWCCSHRAAPIIRLASLATRLPCHAI
jgi:hypothetical protein